MLVLVDPGAGLLPVMPPPPLLAMGPTVGYVESLGDFGARIRHKHGRREEPFSTGCTAHPQVSRPSVCTSKLLRRPMLVVTVRALHMRVSAWLSQLRNPEPEGMVWQRLVL